MYQAVIAIEDHAVQVHRFPKYFTVEPKLQEDCCVLVREGVTLITYDVVTLIITQAQSVEDAKDKASTALHLYHMRILGQTSLQAAQACEELYKLPSANIDLGRYINLDPYKT